MKRNYKIIMITLLLITFICTTASASNVNSQKTTRMQNISDLLNNYFAFRQDSFIGDNKSSENAYKIDKNNATETVLNDEILRKGKIKKMGEKLNFQVVTAKTTPYIMGIEHEITLSADCTGKFKIISDDYDEGPLTEMQSSTFKPKKNEPSQTSESMQQVTQLNSVVPNTLMFYDRDGAATYADAYVDHRAYNNLMEGAYNDMYVNMNIYGGDCCNFANQAIHEGGTFVYYTDLWYHTNGTVGHGTAYTNDDTWSASWSGSTANRNTWIAHGCNRINNPVASNIIKGNPVYYKWNVSSVDDSTIFSHTAICVGTDTSGVPIVDSHNMDYYHVRWNYGGGRSTVQIPSSYPYPY